MKHPRTPLLDPPWVASSHDMSLWLVRVEGSRGPTVLSAKSRFGAYRVAVIWYRKGVATRVARALGAK